MKRNASFCALQKVFVCILACACLVLVGCYPLPVRFPTQTTDASSRKIDLDFLKAGSTTREEVNQKLASIDTGVKQKDFFWGRPHVSKYREILMVGYIPVGPLDRMWGIENLLVSYDANGVVKTFAVVGDSHLLHELDSVDSGALDLSSPVTLDSVTYWMHKNHKGSHEADGPLVLGAESLECFGVKIPRTELRGITLEKSNNSYPRLKILFDKGFDFSKTPLHEKSGNLDLSVDPAQLLLLHRYMDYSKAGSREPAV